MFLWFGMTILASVITTSFIATFTHRLGTDPPRHRSAETAQYVAYQVDQVWEDPAALHKVLQTAHDTFQTGFIVQDPQRRTIDAVGDCQPGPAPRRPSFLHEMERRGPGGAPGLFLPNLIGRGEPPPFYMGSEHSVMVVRHDKAVGWLVMCAMALPPTPPVWRLALPLVVLVLMLGAATYRVAQQLTRPLADLVRVTQSIGAGNLASRVALEKRPPGEVGLLASSINEMAAKIEKQIGDQRTLLAMVSHELRTPLARMRLLVELAQDPQQANRALAEIETEVISIDHIVGALLANARLEFSIVHRQASDAEQLLRRALEGCDPAPSIVSTAEVSWQLSGDITLLARALANIVENAKKYGRGVAAARLRRVQGRIHFEILDRGDGFTEDQVKVFEPFVRSPQAEVIDPTSMGLGLTLVKRVAEAHGGMAYCQNLPEGGACVGFSVEVLPVLQKGTPIPNSNTGNGPKTYNG